MEVHVDVLPVARGGFVEFVIETDIGVFLGGFFEPVPGFSMKRGVSEYEDIINCAPVADKYEFHSAAFVFSGV